MKIVLHILLLSTVLSSFGADLPAASSVVVNTDSLLPVGNVRILTNENEIAGADLRDLEQRYHKTGNNRATLAGLVRILRFKSPLWSSTIRTRLYSDLAGVSVRLKLYPIAMKCFRKQQDSVFGNRDGVLDLQNSVLNQQDSAFDPQDTAFDRQLADLDTAAIVTPDAISSPVAIHDILASFDDGKSARSYAILVHVKQPVPGRRKAFTHINNVGHMFITLIKYNRDNSYRCRSFGFYPNKSSLLAATPLHPRSPSVIKNDAGHEWDEVAGKFISYQRFRKILEVLQSYDHKAYHLGHSNCTDFGLTIAGIGGISIADTRGHWPLGKGNTPGSAGQSMLEGKITNIDTEEPGPLFTDNTVAP